MKLCELQDVINASPFKDSLGFLFQDTCMYFETPVGFLEIFTKNGVVVKSDFVGVLPSKPLIIKTLEPLSMDISWATPIQQRIWQEVCKIPPGQTRSYGEVAKSLNDRRITPRIVGNAMAANRIIYLIPCHRVIKSDGTLGHYSSGGVERKKMLLDWEKQHGI